MTKKQKIKKLILITILILICLLFINIYQKPEKQIINQKIQTSAPPPISIQENSKINKAGIKTQLLVNNILYESKIENPTSIYDFMKQLQNEGKIKFKEKNYIAMGKFIEEINGLAPDGEKYWIYYVNNKKANIGISNYKIKPGDTVTWKYEKNY